MKNVFLIFRSDMRHLMNNVIAAIVVIGLVLIPPMYAWFTTLGFWDPYANTGNLKVAVANDDEGYKSDLLPMRINAGEQVINALRANGQFDWQFVSESDAIQGVKSGAYYAAIVIPASFSADLMTIFSNESIQRSQIVYYTNEKENAIANKITNTGASTLENEIDTTFTQTVADVALDATSNLATYASGDGIISYASTLEARLASTSSVLNEAATQAHTYANLIDSASALLSSADGLLSGLSQSAGETSTLINEARTKLSEAEGSFDDSANTAKIEQLIATCNDIDSRLAQAQSRLESAASTIDDAVGETAQGAASDASEAAAARIAEARERLAQAKTTLESIQGDYDTKIRPAVQQLDNTLESTLASAQTLMSKLKDTGNTLDASSQTASTNMKTLKEALLNTASVLQDASNDLANIDTKLKDALVRNDVDEVRYIIGNNPETVAAFLSAPTEVVKHAVWEMPNNGSAMSPFYTSLSLWIGAIFLVALTSPFVSERRQRLLDNPKPWQLYLGRYLIFGLLALLQATVVCLGNVFFLGIECQHFWLYLLACWLTGFVFSNIVYTLTISFGNVGKAIAIILLVLQLAGSGGIFPIQLSADFFQAIYPWLPFSHSMEAFEGAMAGIYGIQYAQSMGLLAALLIPSLLLGLVFRRPIIKMNNRINEILDETELV